jgi:hypothetical protein
MAFFISIHYSKFPKRYPLKIPELKMGIASLILLEISVFEDFGFSLLFFIRNLAQSEWIIHILVLETEPNIFIH